MQIRYFGTTWGTTEPSIERTLAAIKRGGYDGVEMGAPTDPGERRRLRATLDELGLDLIVQQWTQGATADEHVRSFEEQLRRGLELRPVLVNSHTGRDRFSLPDNLRILRRSVDLAREAGVPVAHELHRGRATFSAPATDALIDALPEVQFTADFSHWCCVHESYLEDFADVVAKTIARSRHIHARVGFPEGPQVSDPRAPEWQSAVEAHVRWWEAIVTHRQREGVPLLTICPEFGPPDYMMVQPYTRQPVVDLWEINRYMMEMLRSRLIP
jgi:sugar phosphate isomerase/epimerase